MAHKPLIGGTGFEVPRGKCLIDGTGRILTGGRTLIGATGYDVPFKPAPLVLYDYGDECTAASGGWTFGIYPASSNCFDYKNGGTQTKVKNSNNIQFGVSTSSYYTVIASVHNETLIDFAPYSEMHLILDESFVYTSKNNTDGNTHANFCLRSVYPTISTLTWNDILVRYQYYANAASSQVNTAVERIVDLSTISQEAYLNFFMTGYQSTANFSAKIYKVWLE